MQSFLCQPSLDGTMPESVISQENNPLLSIDFVHRISPRAAERIFIWGGGGQRQKGHCNVNKRALTVYMRIIITNALMKHQVSFYMLSVVFSWGN